MTWVVLVLGAVVMTAGAVRADDEQDARAHGRRARQAFRAGQYDEALRELEAERVLAPTPEVTFRIARCLDALHRDVLAYRAFDDYVAATEDGARWRSQAVAAVRRLTSQVARIRVATDPPNARLLVDGSETPPLATAPDVVVVAPGPHDLVLRLDGHRAHEQAVDLVAGQELEVQATLEAQSVLLVESEHEGRVIVRAPDGTAVAEGAPPLRVEVPAGSYEVALTVDEGERARETVEVASGGSVTVRLSIAAPTPSAENGHARLTVTATAQGARVLLDGEPAGVVPLVLSEVTPGRHELRLEAAGVEPWTGAIDLRADERVWLTGALAPPPETTHSPWSYVVLGTGGAAILAAVFTGIVSVTMRDDFAQLTDRADPMAAAGLREQGMVVNALTDALWVIGALAVVGGVLLYVLTGERHGPRSDARVVREAP
jgi:hypothetical protein